MVGLGNPGDEYRDTPHNVGENAVRGWAEAEGVSLRRQKSLGVTGRIPGTHIELAIPSGFMNTSGNPVAGLAKYFSVPAERIVVIHDDLDLDAGVVRLKRGGGHGGHNGVRDIARALKSPDFLRVRVGIGRPPGQMDPAKYVVRALRGKQLEDQQESATRAVDAARLLIDKGLDAAQQIVHSP